MKQAYLAYFKVTPGDQDKACALHAVCKQCVEHLGRWTKKVKKPLRFGIPVVWREPKNRFDNCYFCTVSAKRINRKYRNLLVYPNLESAIRLIPHCNEIPVQCLRACRNCICLVLKKIKPPFCPLTVVKPLFQMLNLLFLHHHSFFLKKNIII